MTINFKIISTILILVVSIIAGSFLATWYFKSSTGLDRQAGAESQSQKSVEFLQLIVDKVLKSKEEVGFEERLVLENAVRELDDKAVLKHWQDFIDSSGSEEAQDHLVQILDLLIKNIKE